MEVILTSIFSAIIVFMAVFFIIKILGTAYKREEISFGKYVISITTSFVIGILISSTLPFGFAKVFDAIM